MINKLKKKKKESRKIQGVHDAEHKKKQQTTSKKKKKNSRDYSKRRKKLYDRRTIRRTLAPRPINKSSQ